MSKNIYDKLVYNFDMKIKLHKANKEPFKVKAYVQAMNKLKQNVRIIRECRGYKILQFRKKYS